MPQDKSSGKNSKTNEPTKHGYTNAPNIPVLNEHGIIVRAFLLLPQEYGQKFWVHIFSMIDDHETQGSQEPGHIQFICSINDDQYEEFMSCH